MGSLIRFACEGQTLVGTLDEGRAATGLLIVSGGSEIRSGAHGGMAALARRIAARGLPVFRYDRRGVGDSEGDDPGFAGSLPDLAAAVAAFRTHCPHLERLVAFGNCDAATTLALNHRAVGIDALILANPWVVEPAGDMPPPAAIRRRYRDKLLSIEGWKRLLTLQVDFRQILKGVRRASTAGITELGLAVAKALGVSNAPLTIVLAEGDATAIAFEDAWKTSLFDRPRGHAHVFRVPSRSHSFARVEDAERLYGAVMEALARR
ncbi:hydrolase 1, exosortase A system-associated [Flavisphingomonas formosensis]|uniref:hydrolase 1, exosortase A system-associated n=1 Tax=Flavisphingomonas formosensis TaxID=861534 RepID=UPI0012FBCEAE|nr:hydrolase 1, exosortase A system-associated [Sphingomonas formosensis]